MGWFALVVAGLAVVHFAITYPQFRRVAKGTGFVLAAVVVAVVALIAYSDSQGERDHQAALTRIKPSQVEIAEATLSIDSGPPWASGKLRAIVTNNSQYGITSIGLRTKVTHCPQAGTCRVVADRVITNYSMDVPSGQSREFSGSATFDNLPAMRDGTWSWAYSVAEIRAARD